MFTKAYSPEQSAIGTLDNGMDLMILYIKEFKKESELVSQLKDKKFTYNWFHNQKENSYVLQASWTDDLHIAIQFEQQHYALLANLIEPRTLVVTTLPVKELVVEENKEGDKVSLEFNDNVITLSNMVFEDPSLNRH